MDDGCVFIAMKVVGETVADEGEAKEGSTGEYIEEEAGGSAVLRGKTVWGEVG